MDYASLEDRYLQTSFGRVHFIESKGTQNPIILLHGLGATTQAWHRLVGFIPDNYKVVILDELGHGKSDAPRIAYSVFVQLAVLKELINAEHMQSPNIVGHSYGGWIAARYALEGNPCKNLVLVAPGGLRHDEPRPGHEQRREQLRKFSMMNNTPMHVVESVFETRDGLLDQSDLAKINARTLIIWGENDAIIEPQYANSFKQIPDSRLEIIKEARHSPHYTHAEQVSRLILDFIG